MREPSEPSTAPAAAPPPQERARGGGYYKDDGPGANPPANLADIPDAEPKAEPLQRGPNRPYVVFGKAYEPMASLQPFSQRGVASWYGRRFHGQKTSSGEPYDMYAMTAAHPTLPIPSYARVTNTANGKSVIVRINDRGPFLHGRIMDLSYVAAYKLGYVNNGSAEVEVESLSADGAAPVMAAAIETPAVQVEPIATAPLAPAIPVETAGAPTGQVFLQLGAFKSPEGAESFLGKMRSELADTSRTLSLYNKGGLTRVQYGPYANANDARNAANKLASSLGFKPFVSMH